MVAADIQAAIAEAWGTEPRRVLITGGSGFIGGALADALTAMGHDVVVVGRNPYRRPPPPHHDGASYRFARCDLSDPQQLDHLSQLCRDRDFVFHAAARSSAWGSLDSFQAANVTGTANILRACKDAGIGRLVHVSTSAIFFDFRHRVMVRDDDAWAATPACHYAATKGEAERLVQAAVADGMNATVIRARAVFGPGDTSLLPKIVAAADAGRLRIIGDGKNLIDLTYIDNLIYALALAAVRGEPGDAITITNDEPVELWPFLDELLRKLGRPMSPWRRLSASQAMLVARMIEALYRWRRSATEPPLTRYSAGLLAYSQTFDQAKAKEVLGYRPLTPLADGLNKTVAHWQGAGSAGGAAPTPKVRLQAATTGYTEHRGWLAERGSREAILRFHASIFAVQHPTRGLVLFDTGVSPHLHDACRRWPMSLYRKLLPFEFHAGSTAAHALEQMGLDAREISTIVLSHFHPDHIGGLRCLPPTDVVAHRTAWEAVRQRRGLAALRRAFIPGLLPDDFSRRLHLIDLQAPAWGPFPRTHDLFGDGAIRLVDLSGHATGQLGAVLNTSEGWKLLAFDASWTLRTIDENLRLPALFRWLADSRADAARSVRRIRELRQGVPECEVVLSHCPATAAAHELDAFYARLKRPEQSAPLD